MKLKERLFPQRACLDSISELRGSMWAVSDARRLKAQLTDLERSIEVEGRGRASEALRAASAPSEALQVDAAGVAHIPVDGMIVARARSAAIWRFFGLRATASEEIRDAVNAAAEDERVKSIALQVDTLGGAVLGLKEAADAIFAARDKKPIDAHIQLEGFSAGYYLASQANTITAGAGAEVGSIGVVMTIADYSEMVESEGIKVHVISTGPMKGAGSFGSEVTDTHLAGFQKRVDELGAEFKAAIVRGRGMKEAAVDKLATGEFWSASTAVELGLIDAIAGPDGAANAVTKDAPAAGANNVTKGEDVSKEELSALQAQLEAERARREAAESALDAVSSGRKANIIKAGQGTGRIVAAMLASVQAYAEHASAEDLEGFVAALPVQTKAEPKGGTPPQEDVQVDAAMGEFAEKFGVSKTFVRKSMIESRTDEGVGFCQAPEEGE